MRLFVLTFLSRFFIICISASFNGTNSQDHARRIMAEARRMGFKPKHLSHEIPEVNSIAECTHLMKECHQYLEANAQMKALYEVCTRSAPKYHKCFCDLLQETLAEMISGTIHRQQSLDGAMLKLCGKRVYEAKRYIESVVFWDAFLHEEHHRKFLQNIDIANEHLNERLERLNMASIEMAPIEINQENVSLEAITIVMEVCTIL